MFNRRTQRKVIIVVAVFLSVALVGSSFVGLGSLFSNPWRNTNTQSTPTAQEEYDMLVEEITQAEGYLAAGSSSVALLKYVAELYTYKAGSGLSPDARADWGMAADRYQLAYDVALAEEKVKAEEAQTEAETGKGSSAGEGSPAGEEGQDEEQKEPVAASTEILYSLAYCSQMAQRYEVARTDYLRLLELVPENVSVHYQYGVLLQEGFDDRDGAIGQWETAKTLTEDESWLSWLDSMIGAAREPEDQAEGAQTGE